MPELTDRPNIIMILADDMGSWAMGCAGNSEIQTPQLDRLARSGVRFTNFFCASPVCSPARASLLTGRMPSEHGILDWIRAGNSPLDRDSDPVAYLENLTGYSDLLARNGYKCALSGKWHLGDSLRPQKGFTFWEVLAGGYSGYYNASLVRDGQIYTEPGYLTEAITTNALRFLDEHLDETRTIPTPSPFYLGVHYFAPHSPWDRDQHPAEFYDYYFEQCPFASLPLEPMHPWQINSAPYGSDPAKRRAILSGYFAAITAMDRQIGRLLDWLDTNGLRDNTLVVFMSDNGMNMGHHGIYGKGNGTLPQNMFDSSVKVPAIFSLPGHLPQNQVCDRLVSHYDFYPTLFDFLGLPVPVQELPGHSFASVLRAEAGPDQAVPVVVFDEYGPVRMVRDQEWKYIHRYPDGPHELYRLSSDPDERQNLVADPLYEPRVREMKDFLERWFERFVSPRFDGRSQSVTGMGQLGPIATPSDQSPFANDWHYLSTGSKETKP